MNCPKCLSWRVVSKPHFDDRLRKDIPVNRQMPDTLVTGWKAMCLNCGYRWNVAATKGTYPVENATTDKET